MAGKDAGKGTHYGPAQRAHDKHVSDYHKLLAAQKKANQQNASRKNAGKN